jgi:ribosomal-protein-alanine acetyltransferase
VKIRSANIADIPEVLALERESETAAHWSNENYYNIFRQEGPARLLLVTGDKGFITGFLVARIVEAEWEIENVVVTATTRRRGIASLLLQETMERARKQGARQILLEVRGSNTAARCLYEKAGFQQSGRRLNYYSDPPEDAIAYSLELHE